MGSKRYNRSGYDNEEPPQGGRAQERKQSKDRQHTPGETTSVGQAAEYIRQNKSKKQKAIDDIMKDL